MAFPQISREIAIEFDHVQVRQFFEQGFRERAKTWADFNNEVRRLNFNRGDDFRDDVTVMQKMLAETFASDVLQI